MGIFTTNLRKMNTSLDSVAQYMLPIVDVLERTGEYYMNSLVGEDICITYAGQIHCVDSGRQIKKTFGDGLSYESFLRSPMAVPSIIRPELSRIHEGIALRDAAWEEEHHNRPHYVYLSRTSGIKVGVTRLTNKISRWIDQGATEGIVLAETPYRQLAGLIEVALKEHVADKTAWQGMLKNASKDDSPLLHHKERMMSILAAEYEGFFHDDDEVTTISYPVLQYPAAVKSVKLDNTPIVRGKLTGIRGQYLMFDDGRVLNIRSHSGYRIRMEF